MKKLVLTGGPCAGKSTVLEKLAEKFGDEIVIVPEVATRLFEAGFPPPDPWTQAWQDALQAAVICGQHKAESQAETEAARKGARAIVCDRGLLDGAAYVAGGVQEFCDRFKVSERESLNQYEAVVHLESLSTLRPEMYERLTKTNPNRFEEPEMAREREYALRQAWARHPSRIHLADELEVSAAKVVKIVENL